MNEYMFQLMEAEFDRRIALAKQLSRMFASQLNLYQAYKHEAESLTHMKAMMKHLKVEK